MYVCVFVIVFKKAIFTDVQRMSDLEGMEKRKKMKPTHTHEWTCVHKAREIGWGRIRESTMIVQDREWSLSRWLLAVIVIMAIASRCIGRAGRGKADPAFEKIILHQQDHVSDISIAKYTHMCA